MKRVFLLVFIIFSSIKAAVAAAGGGGSSVPTLDEIRAQMAAITPEQRAAQLAAVEALPPEQRAAVEKYLSMTPEEMLASILESQKQLIEATQAFCLDGTMMYEHPAGFSFEEVIFPEEISGSLVTLKRTTAEHVPLLMDLFSDAVQKSWGTNFSTDAEKTTFFNNMLRMQAAQVLISYSIFDKKDNIIGQIDVRGVFDMSGVNATMIDGQYGVWVNEAFWGKGHALEAVKLLVKNYFEITKTDRLNAFLKPGNLRSQKAHEKLGFKHVATMTKSGQLVYEITADSLT